MMPVPSGYHRSGKGWEPRRRLFASWGTERNARLLVRLLRQGGLWSEASSVRSQVNLVRKDRVQRIKVMIEAVEQRMPEYRR